MIVYRGSSGRRICDDGSPSPARSLLPRMREERDPWSDAFGGIREQHLARACSNAGIEIGEIAHIIGDNFDVSWMWDELRISDRRK